MGANNYISHFRDLVKKLIHKINCMLSIIQMGKHSASCDDILELMVHKSADQEDNVNDSESYNPEHDILDPMANTQTLHDNSNYAENEYIDYSYYSDNDVNYGDDYASEHDSSQEWLANMILNDHASHCTIQGQQPMSFTQCNVVLYIPVIRNQVT